MKDIYEQGMDAVEKTHQQGMEMMDELLDDAFSAETEDKTEAEEETESEPETESKPETKPEPKPNYYLNENNSHYTPNTVSVNPRHAYRDNGKLVVECFVINGYPTTVRGVNLTHFEISVDGKLVALANFGLLPSVNIPAYHHQLFTFTFPSEAISQYGAALADLDRYYELSSLQ